MKKNPDSTPAICLAGILLLAAALSGCRSTEAYQQVSTAKIETAANPSQVTPVESSNTEDTKGEEEFTLAMVPEYSGNAYADINDDVPFFSEDELTVETFQEYWPLDELGRCTGAYACIGPDSLPTEPRENISMIEPTGWHSVQYENIDRGYLYNRCHLIGYQLTGQSANEKNLITGTRYMNVEGMLPFENSVEMYVEGTGNHVLYRVRPYYKGGDLVATGVLMEAKSIEDPLVQFCAFCYNVQPGIEIDYATGESKLKGTDDSDEILTIVADSETGDSESLTRSSEHELPADEEEPARSSEHESPADEEDTSRSSELESTTEREVEKTSSEEPEEITYVLNTNTKKFHQPYCSSVQDIKDKNKKETTQSREEIISRGYKPCKRCNP